MNVSVPPPPEPVLMVRGAVPLVVIGVGEESVPVTLTFVRPAGPVGVPEIVQPEAVNPGGRFVTTQV